MKVDTYLVPASVQTYGDSVRHRIVEWYEAQGRSFPWRRASHEVSELKARYGPDAPLHDPYEILVSETMLQQTQAVRVERLLPSFLEKFPTVRHLADATVSDVIVAWRGLGYNSRAVRLRETAQTLVNAYGATFPRTLEELAKLPGVGEYTASALLCFAFGAQVAVVDVNVRRTLSRVFAPCHDVGSLRSVQQIATIDEFIMPLDRAYDWHQALMDFGASVCTRRRPKCSECVLAEMCLSSASLNGPTLYSTNAPAARKEPEVGGVPRRVVRGWIVEELRRSKRALRVRRLVDMVLSRVSQEQYGEVQKLDQQVERNVLVAIQQLISDGILERGENTREDAAAYRDIVRLKGDVSSQA